MVGARSLSTIETAPVNRRPIRTEVVKNSPEILAKAIQTRLNVTDKFLSAQQGQNNLLGCEKIEEQFPKVRVGIDTVK